MSALDPTPHSHNTLITGTVTLNISVIKTLGDIGTLLFDSNQDITCLVVEPFFGRVVPNLFDGVPNDLLEVDLGFRGDFTEDLALNQPIYIKKFM
jgi:hypothetical protein